MAEILVKDGKRVAIIRPDDPTLALKLVQAIHDGTPHKKAARAFNRMLESQPYRYMGFAATDGRHFTDELGIERGTIEPGDSFVDFDSIRVKDCKLKAAAK